MSSWYMKLTDVRSKRLDEINIEYVSQLNPTDVMALLSDPYLFSTEVMVMPITDLRRMVSAVVREVITGYDQVPPEHANRWIRANATYAAGLAYLLPAALVDLIVLDPATPSADDPLATEWPEAPLHDEDYTLAVIPVSGIIQTLVEDTCDMTGICKVPDLIDSINTHYDQLATFPAQWSGVFEQAINSQTPGLMEITAYRSTDSRQPKDGYVEHTVYDTDGVEYKLLMKEDHNWLMCWVFAQYPLIAKLFGELAKHLVLIDPQ